MGAAIRFKWSDIEDYLKRSRLEVKNSRMIKKTLDD